MKVFISYSREDEIFVRKLEARLRSENLDVLRDVRSLLSGQIEEQIEKIIRKDIHAMVLVLSASSAKSDWVFFEFDVAREREIQEGVDLIFPIRLDEEGSTEYWSRRVTLRLKEYNILDFSSPEVFESPFEKLIGGLRRSFERRAKKALPGRRSPDRPPGLDAKPASIDLTAQKELIASFLREQGYPQPEPISFVRQLLRPNFPELEELPGNGRAGVLRHISPDGHAIAWIVGLSERSEITEDLKRECLALLEESTRWPITSLERIFFCIPWSLSAKETREIYGHGEERRDSLAYGQARRLERTRFSLFGHSAIAKKLMTTEALQPLKEEVLRSIHESLDSRHVNISILDGVKEADEESDSLLSSYDADIDHRTKNVHFHYKNLLRNATDLEGSESSLIVLETLSEICLLVDATRGAARALRAELPEIRRKINASVWPKTYAALQAGKAPGTDLRIEAAALYFNLRIGPSEISDFGLKRARLAIEAAAEDPAFLHEIFLRLIPTLFKALQKRGRYEDVMRLMASISPLIAESEQASTSELQRCLLEIAFVCNDAERFGDGDDDYREALRQVFGKVLGLIEDFFWQSALKLLHSISKTRQESEWSHTSRDYIKAFEGIAPRSADTPAKAATYLTLSSWYQQFKNFHRFEACSDSLDFIGSCPKAIKSNARIKIRRLFLLIDVLWTAPNKDCIEIFPIAEQALRKDISFFDESAAALLKLRFLAIFVFRICSPAVFSRELLNTSTLTHYLVTEGSEKYLRDYFGFDISLQPRRRNEAAGEFLRRAAVPKLISQGRQRYARVVLPNLDLPLNWRSSALINYVEFTLRADSVREVKNESRYYFALLDTLHAQTPHSSRAHLYLARIYQKRRELEKAESQVTAFWESATPFLRNREAAFLARIKYERALYSKEPLPQELPMELQEIAHTYLDTAVNRHFFNAHLAFSLIGEDSCPGAEQESAFLKDLLVEAEVLHLKLTERVTSKRLVYTDAFHRFLKSSETSLARAFKLSIGDPTIFNDTATFCRQTHLKPVKQLWDSLPQIRARIRALYLIAVALAERSRYFGPKYQYNLAKFDFECFVEAPETFDLGDIVDRLSRIRGNKWAPKYLRNEVADYFRAHIDSAEVVDALSQERSRRWRTLNAALKKKAR